MQLNNSTIQPKKGHQIDKYQGDLHPTSKLRHGNGTYLYENAFFTYEGQYHMGKKQGQGVIKFKDGRIITGQAEIKYPDGSSYRGQLAYGQKSGIGIYLSPFQTYEGEWKDNKKHGSGNYKNLSTSEQYSGEYENNKFHGRGKLTKWNYEYQGQFKNGLKDGQGKQFNDWQITEDKGTNNHGRFQFVGNYKQNKFQGLGVLKSRQSNYVYSGQFHQAFPICKYFVTKLYISTNSKNAEGLIEGQKILLNLATPIQYELEGDSFNLVIQTVFQGPEVLDEIQPTSEEIEIMIKNWQNENKKNKNPPPMPNFSQPRMKKPEMRVVTQQNGRPISVRLLREAQGKQQLMKIDYRAEIIAKRKQNEDLRQQAMKKAEQDAGKKGGKKDNKGELELKVNLFKGQPHKRQTALNIQTKEGVTKIHAFQLPDDFPFGKYFLQISSPYKDFGEIKTLKKQFNVKQKVVKKK